jgi:stringent starvation protein B
MDYTALKPCRFGGNAYRIGETVPGEAVASSMAKRLTAGGVIAPLATEKTTETKETNLETIEAKEITPETEETTETEDEEEAEKESLTERKTPKKR